MSKGSGRRPEKDKGSYAKGYDAIFNKESKNDARAKGRKEKDRPTK